MQKSAPDMFNLNQPLSRLGTHSEKYDLRDKLFGTDDVLPMWVADMDLPTPPFILNALKSRLNHPILGYTLSSDALYQAIIDWQAQHDYKVKKSEIIFTHNVANGFYMAVQAFTGNNDGILVQPPIYPPFLNAPEQNQRKTVEAPLSLIEGRYEIDFAEFENQIIENQIKLFLFCNPQNPSGRVWLPNELEKIIEICHRHNVIIVSDEIHSDLVYLPLKHTPLASLSDQAREITVTLSSPGKTFNLGGLQIGYAIIHNSELKQRYLNICQANHIDGLNLFAHTALIAAYSTQGKEWRNQLLTHFSENIRLLERFLSQEFPAIKMMQPEASYLVWLDFSALFNSQAELKEWLIKQAKLGLNDGQSFGGKSHAGDGFMRINLAVPQKTLEEAMQQLKHAKSSLS